jgi:hypothetical protein
MVVEADEGSILDKYKLHNVVVTEGNTRRDIKKTLWISVPFSAFAMLAAVRRRATETAPPKSRTDEQVRRWCADQSRKSAG